MGQQGEEDSSRRMCQVNLSHTAYSELRKLRDGESKKWSANYSFSDVILALTDFYEMTMGYDTNGFAERGRQKKRGKR
jgi:hypothetical protein